MNWANVNLLGIPIYLRAGFMELFLEISNVGLDKVEILLKAIAGSCVLMTFTQWVTIVILPCRRDTLWRCMLPSVWNFMTHSWP